MVQLVLLPDTARFLEENFAPVNDVEDLVTEIHKVIEENAQGTPEQ